MKTRLQWMLTLLFVLCALGSCPHAAGAQTPEPCKTAQLQASEDRSDAHEISGGMGHQARVLAIKNQSAMACSVQGVPALTLAYSLTHEPFTTKVCPNCQDYLFQPQPVARVLLQPGGLAWVVVGLSITDGLESCTNPKPEYSSITLGLALPESPGQTGRPLTVAIPDWRSCGPLNITPFLAQPPQNGELAAK